MSFDRSDRSPACPVCEGSVTRELFRVSSPFLDQLSYLIYRCAHCHHRFADGPIGPDLLAQVYGAAFHETSQQRGASDRSAVVRNARRRADWLRDMIPRGRLLDVGAGRGYFVQAASRYFEAEGIDYSSNAERYGQEIGVRLTSGDFHQMSSPATPFDVLTFWDVLAGMPDVRETIACADRLLAPGGLLVLTVPLGDSLACRVAGRRWPLWIPPVNLHYFSRRSIRLLLESKGFSLIEIRCLPKRVALNFLLLKLARSFGMPSVVQWLASISVPGSIPLNLGDIGTVVARRRTQ